MTYHSTPGHVQDNEVVGLIGDILAITGDTRILIVPVTLTGTSVTDSSKNAHTLTSNESVAGWLSHTSRALAYDLDGSADLMYCADHADFSFGDASDDVAFSCFALINGDAFSGDNYLVAKHEYNGSAYEWHLHLTNGKPYFQLHDKSVPATIARYRDSALSTSTWYLVGGTYDGGSLVGGIKVYVDGVQVDDTDGSTGGSYVAMENTASGFSIGAMLDTSPAGMSFLNGRIACVCVCAKELSASEMWMLNKIIKGHFGV